MGKDTIASVGPWSVVLWLPTIILGVEIVAGGVLFAVLAASGRSESLTIIMYVSTAILLTTTFITAVLFGILAWEKRMFPAGTNLWNILSWYPTCIFLLWFCLATSWISSPANQWNAATSAGIDVNEPGSGAWTVAWRLLFTAVTAVNGLGSLTYMPTGTLSEALMAGSLVLWWTIFFMFMITGLNLLVANVDDKSKRRV